ncbi:MAG: PASTA domain-containing protein, partial [Dehalococcoidia bacterium]|nr:PASTA domain-containing protein [Dehalococcoidia bacterium]
QRFASAAQMGQALVECLARSQEDTAALRLVTPAPASTPPPAVSGATRRQPAPLPGQRAKRGFSWGPVAAAFAIVALVAGLTLASPSLVRLFLTPARSNSFSSPTPAPALTPPPTSAPTVAALALVPGVTGMLPVDARLLIEGQGLVYREDPREASNDVPEGRVLRQAPPPGRTASQGSAVTVTISLGPAMVRVPALTEMTVVQAESRLKDIGLRASFREVWSATIPAGVVFQQEPAPGALISKGSAVTLTASKGKEKVAVPNVVGLSEDKAQRAIQQAGLRNFLYVNYQGHDVLPDSALVKVCVGCVLSVTPSPGEMVELGTEIRMAVRDRDKNGGKKKD